MAYDFFGIPVSELNVWLIWILPFAAAMIIPAVGKFSKLTTGRVAVAFAAMSAMVSKQVFLQILSQLSCQMS